MKQKNGTPCVQFDLLTKLYSRESGELAAKEMLLAPTDGICCMLLIDIDSFNAINCSYGTIFGDSILHDMGGIISEAAGPEAVSMRYNKDVFLTVIPDSSRADATGIAKIICDRTRAMYSGENSEISISCSIGIVTSSLTSDFDRLIGYATSTLSYVKKYNRGSYSYYLDFSEITGNIIGYEYKDVSYDGGIINDNKSLDDIVSYSFKILEESKDPRSGIKLFLSRLGHQFNLSMAGFYQTDRLYMRNVCQHFWIKDSDGLDLILSYSFKDDRYITDFISKVNRQGYVEAKPDSVDEIPMLDDVVKRHPMGGEYSILMFPTYSASEFTGYFFFGDVTCERKWKHEEIDVFYEVSRILISYIGKASADSASRAKTSFLSRMSHEIRTPMNAIIGMTEIADTMIRPYYNEEISGYNFDSADEKECRSLISVLSDYIGKIDVSAKYLLSLINDILDMSKIEDGKMKLVCEPVNLEKIFENIELVASQQAQNAGIKLVIEKQLKDRYIYSDELRLSQTLLNLVSNAVKFTPEGGTVTVGIRQIEEKSDGSQAAFAFYVNDTGIGIRKENIEKIFKPFEQADDSTAKAYGGSGLGLTISSTFVRMMGGCLKCESEPGVGTRFSFELTLEKSIAPGSEPEKILNNSDFDFSGCRVLVVEDNALNAEIAQTILEMVHFEVDTAADGKQGLEAYINHPSGYYDAILMDIRMPVMDGLEATKRIRSSEKEDAFTIPILAMSANAFEEDVNMSFASGLNGHLSKPIDVNALYNTLNKFINNKR